MRSKSNPGIVERHSRSCANKRGGACNCSPSFMAWAWDKKAGVKVYQTYSGKGAKSAAKSWRADRVHAANRGRPLAPSPLTFREKAEAWLADAEAGLPIARGETTFSPSTLRGYRRDLEDNVLPYLGALKLGAIARRDLVALKDRLWRENPSWSGQRIRNIFTPVQAIFRDAIHHDEIELDPTSDLPLPQPARRRERVATPTETADLLGALPDDLRPIYAVAAYAGLRRGEIRGLRVSDIRFNGERCVNVERSWDDVAGEKAPKSSAGVRKTLLPETLRVIVEENITRTGRSGDELLLGRTTMAPFTPSHVGRRARKAWQAANVNRVEDGLEPLVSIGLHELRHSFSTFLDHAGVSADRADRYMGHSNPSVQARYRHQLPGQLEEDA
ncbi:MAG: tyrosine-type recombinase/integrase, partial [Actinobacteria bacterium]|nr:tyrosine-type recombinase/integrase [Actinomycetota bacterium]